MSSPAPLLAAERALTAGAPRQAVQLAQPFLSADNRRIRARALRTVAEALHALGRDPLALQTLQVALQLEPHEPAGWRVASDLFAALGDATQAERALQMRVRLQPGDAPAWEQLAELRLRRDDLPGAVEALSAAILRLPRRVDLLRRRIELLHELGSVAALQRCVTEALAVFPAHPELRVLAASARYLQGDVPGASAHVDAALAADPGHLLARITRASYRLMARDRAGALADVEQVLAWHPSEPSALELRARIHLARGEAQAACTDLDRAMEGAAGLPAERRALLHLRRGHAREATEDCAGALDDYVAGQELLGGTRRFRLADVSGYRALLRRRFEALAPGSPLVASAPAWAASLPEDAPLRGCPPVFVVGFPRSGTTLVERILGGHSSLVPTDEADLLGQLSAEVRHRCGGRSPHELSEAEVVALRARYAKEARQRGAPPESGLRVIDKLPLSFVEIALMRRVFPDAPVIFVVRDPRDCVWSSFCQSFSPNAAMASTTSIAGTASLYDETLRIWLRARQIPALCQRVTELRYEQLVGDLEAGARALCVAAGVPWEPAVLDFQRGLAGQFVRTPSATAVGRRVSTARVGRWRRFRAVLEPVLPVLAPYVAHFDYPAD